MPQINRIRVNNVKYNFGTQFYDDFIMRFHCGNTIYDLANGGGKSLLMLLLLQNLIPNCTLDEKQPVEKLFRPGSGNTVIHSLIEWKLDPCYQREKYTYMTTGFCARKGRNTEDGEDSGTASVEYFNYCIFYREFGDNDIRNLPLSNGEERVTYGGLKTYLRELNKNDLHVEVHIFDRKGDYQHFISRYGLFESEWEIIRGINKTEGHVRTYFESTYRTSRKVVEDLLIEEIIQKSFLNKTEQGTSDETEEEGMAQTLLNIKDKLTELAGKHACLQDYDGQAAALQEFADYLQSFSQLYQEKETRRQELFQMLLDCRAGVAAQEKHAQQLADTRESLEEELVQEQQKVQVAAVLEQKKSLQELQALVTASRKEADQAEKEFARHRDRLLQQEAANEYQEYRAYEQKMQEVQAMLDNRLRSHEDITRELQRLAVFCLQKGTDRKAELTEREEKTGQRLREVQEQEQHTDAALQEMRQNRITAGGQAAQIAQILQEKQERFGSLLADSGILVAEGVQEALEQAQDVLQQMQEEQRALEQTGKQEQEKLQQLQNRIAGAEAVRRLCEAQLQTADTRQEEAARQELEDRFHSLLEVYLANGVPAGQTQQQALVHAVRETYERMQEDNRQKEEQIRRLTAYAEHVAAGEYVVESEDRSRLEAYLTQHYGSDVVDGHTWLMHLDNGQKRDVRKRAPFVEYGYVILGDFSRIQEDEVLHSLGRPACAIPVMSEEILMDTQLEVNREHVVFAGKDLTFLRDDARKDAELRAVREELDGLKQQLEKGCDRAAFVWEDLQSVIWRMARQQEEAGSQGGRTEAEQLQKQKQEAEAELQQLIPEAEKLRKQAAESAALLQEKQDKNGQLRRKAEHLQQTALLQEELEHLQRQKAQLLSRQEEATGQEEILRGQLEKEMAQLEEAKQAYAAANADRKALEERLTTIYRPYAGSAEQLPEETGLDLPQAESRFAGLKAVLEDKTADLADKKALLAQYQLSMEKCRNAIAYRNVSMEELQKAVQEGRLQACDPVVLLEQKRQIDQAERKMRDSEAELEAQSALMNRLEGSVEHGIGQIREKYGEFIEFPCEDPQLFISRHKQMETELEQRKKEIMRQEKDCERETREIFAVAKEMERIVRSADMEVPDQAFTAEPASADPAGTIRQAAPQDLNLCETRAREFEAFTRKEYKSKETFEKKKQETADCLTRLHGQELAEEIRRHMDCPDNEEQTRALQENLHETVSLISLEKERVEKGITDMEQMKTSFVNRCLQTCSNIRGELDKLSRLSTIMLEDQPVSVIGLQIPYIKEEFYAERMSDYIEETVSIAESFTQTEEQLRYIRSRLSWKRLFSVIVSDMNAVRVSLYKRERISDQSRYLRYEEAVGSTGQSQGIYIQFLIAVINYISCINAPVEGSTGLGKTVFIDNPFGAAKDVYIWEPIFALLKRNHVQLIVPARGATPAITGRFDVNYVLGQKLTGGRQQTVVVEYFSNTRDVPLEYRKMEYEQTSLAFS